MKVPWDNSEKLQKQPIHYSIKKFGTIINSVPSTLMELNSLLSGEIPNTKLDKD